MGFQKYPPVQVRKAFFHNKPFRYSLHHNYKFFKLLTPVTHQSFKSNMSVQPTTITTAAPVTPDHLDPLRRPQCTSRWCSLQALSLLCTRLSANRCLSKPRRPTVDLSPGWSAFFATFVASCVVLSTKESRLPS